jgi:hypothetical protein
MIDRRLRDEVGLAAPPATAAAGDAPHANPAGEPATGDSAAAGDSARQVIADARERRGQHDLWLAREALRVLGEEKQALADRVAELEQVLEPMRDICQLNADLEAELGELKLRTDAFDLDLAVSIERLHARAVDILLADSGSRPPSQPMHAVAVASTALADSLTAYARERRLAAQASARQRPRSSLGQRGSEGERR